MSEKEPFRTRRRRLAADQRTTFANNLAEADLMSRNLASLRPDLELPEVPPGIRGWELKLVLKARRTQLAAAQLGLPFDLDEDWSDVEARTLSNLPTILEQKGLVPGAVILKNIGSFVEGQHEIVSIPKVGEKRALIMDLEGDHGVYRYYAVDLAVFASVVIPAPDTYE